jgi:hypothetical protein
MVRGACVAPGAKYMKNGLSGVSAFWNCIQAIALSVMSVMKLYFGSRGISTAFMP